MGEFSDCPHCEYSDRNQQSLEDHINWSYPELKEGSGTLEINKGEEEAIDIDLTEPIELTPKTPNRKFSPVRSPEEVITTNTFTFFQHIYIQYVYCLFSFFRCLCTYLVMLLPVSHSCCNHITYDLLRGSYPFHGGISSMANMYLYKCKAIILRFFQLFNMQSSLWT